MADWYMTGFRSLPHESQPFYPFATTITQHPLVPLQSLPQTPLFQSQDYNVFQARNSGTPPEGFEGKMGFYGAWKMDQNGNYYCQSSPLLQHQQLHQMMMSPMLRQNCCQEFFEDSYGIPFYFPQAFDTACIIADRNSLYNLNQEQYVASNNFAPSRPLSLLMEPVTINHGAHARKTKRMFLSYEDVHHEPDGARIQRAMEEHKRKCKREEVKNEAAVADVIDLISDEY